jgi:hypothetical protein
MAIERAVIFLRELLAGGPLPATVVQTRAEAAGFSWGTTRRAKDQLQIKAVRESAGGSGDGQWFWSLSKGQDAQAQAAQGQDAQAQAAQTQAATSPRLRVITVRRRGAVPEGPDQISWDLWQSLGSEVGENCPRIKQFLRERAALSGSSSPGGK